MRTDQKCPKRNRGFLCTCLSCITGASQGAFGDISLMIAWISSALSARTKIRPSLLLTSTPRNDFRLLRMRSTSIRSKYGLFMPFKATSPQRTMRMFCSFMVILLSISSIVNERFQRDQRKLPSLRKRCTAALSFSAVYSISSIVLNSLKLKRIAPSISFGESPMAFKTCEPFAEA